MYVDYIYELLLYAYVASIIEDAFKVGTTNAHMCIARHRKDSSGTGVMVLKIFSPKNFAKTSAFLTQNKAKF
jgi:hypothetical protein